MDFQRTLGVAFRMAGQNLMAVQCLQRLLAAAEDAHGPQHPTVAQALTTLATVLLETDVPQAVRVLERSLAIREATAGPDSPELCATLLALAKAYKAKGDAPGGHALLIRSLKLVEDRLAGRSSQVQLNPRDAAEQLLGHLDALAQSEMALAKAAAAAALEAEHANLEAALAQMAQGERHGAEGLRIPEVVAQEATRTGGRAAASHLVRGIETWERAFGPRHEQLVPLLNKLAEACIAAGDPKKAIASLERAADLAKAASHSSEILVSLLDGLRSMYIGIGDTEQAARVGQRLVEAVQTGHGRT